MTMTLFDQNKAVELYAKEREIRGIVETCQEFGTPIKDIISHLSKRFGITPDESADQVKTYWKGQLPAL